MKLGVKIKIDVTKIEKARLYEGKKGKYLDATVFIDPDNPGQYGDHGMITQDVTKEERDNKVQGPILGNVEVFWRDDVQQSGNSTQREQSQNVNQGSQSGSDKPQSGFDNFDDNIPF